MQTVNKPASFEQAVIPHLAAAYNLARWITRNDSDAEDVVQEAYLRAFRFFGGFHGEDGKAWLLTIVRNTCYTWLKQNRPAELTTGFDEEMQEIDRVAAPNSPNPEAILLQSASRQLLQQALEELPVEYREVLILRELEELSYKEIATIADLPLGTVMSRLARARKRLQQALIAQRGTGAAKGTDDKGARIEL